MLRGPQNGGLSAFLADFANGLQTRALAGDLDAWARRLHEGVETKGGGRTAGRMRSSAAQDHAGIGQMYQANQSDQLCGSLKFGLHNGTGRKKHVIAKRP